MPGMPLVTTGQVYAQDVDNGVLYVVLKGSYQSPITVQYGTPGAADALRAKQDPMPGIGSWCVVAFPGGDIRNGIWLRSYFPSQMDALTTTTASGAAATDPFIDYQSHFSGYWNLLDGTGNSAFQYPDGSFGVFGSGAALPTVYRHVVQNNKRTKMPFTFAERIPKPPSTFQGFFQQASGTSFALDTSGSVTVSGSPAASLKFLFGQSTQTISSSGNVTVSGAPNASLEFLFGKSTFDMDGSGNVTVSGAPSAILKFVFGGTTLEIDGAGQTILSLAGSDNLTIAQGGGSAGDFLALVSKLVSKFNAHVHINGGGTGNSGVPSSAWSSGDIDSTIIKISN